MNTQKQNGYMLLFRGTDLRKGLSPAELQKVTDNWMAWFRRLTEEGKAVAGIHWNAREKLFRVRTVSCPTVRSPNPKKQLAVISFSTFATIDEAIAIAKECPGLPYGIRVEVRPVAGECPIAADLRAESTVRTSLTARSPKWRNLKA